MNNCAQYTYIKMYDGRNVEMIRFHVDWNLNNLQNDNTVCDQLMLYRFNGERSEVDTTYD